MEYIYITAASILFLSLLMFAVRSTRDRHAFTPVAGLNGFDDFESDIGPQRSLASSAIQRIFAAEDAKFISQFADKNLLTLFRQERKRLAVSWIVRNRLQADFIMREHLKASRLSRDLQLSGESQVFLSYIRLRLHGEFLLLAVSLVGPQNLHSAASSASRTFHGLRRFSERIRERRHSASA
jgi:hypothetical protein